MLYTETVYLNGIVKNHRLEDGKVRAHYELCPAEPDVGIMNDYVELYVLTSMKGNVLRRITNALTQEMIDDIVTQINENINN